MYLILFKKAIPKYSAYPRILNIKEKGSRTIVPEENCPPTPKLTLTKSLTLTRGQFFSRTIIWFPPNPKTNPNFDQNPTLTGWQFSSGGNCPDTKEKLNF